MTRNPFEAIRKKIREGTSKTEAYPVDDNFWRRKLGIPPQIPFQGFNTYIKHHQEAYVAMMKNTSRRLDYENAGWPSLEGLNVNEKLWELFQAVGYIMNQRVGIHSSKEPALALIQIHAKSLGELLSSLFEKGYLYEAEVDKLNHIEAGLTTYLQIEDFHGGK